MDVEQLWNEKIISAERALLESAACAYSDSGWKSAAEAMERPPLVNSAKIAEIVDVLAKSAGCAPGNIIYTFDPIFEDGCLNTDELALTFSMPAVENFEVVNKRLHSMLVAVPQEVSLALKKEIDAYKKQCSASQK